MEHMFETEIACTEREEQKKAETLGKEPELTWMKIVIDLTAIVAVRENIDDEGKPQVTLYTVGDNFTVRGKYEDIRARWLKAKTPGTKGGVFNYG